MAWPVRAHYDPCPLWSRWLAGKFMKSDSHPQPKSLQTLQRSFSAVSKRKFCKKICVGKLSPRSTQCTPLHCSKITFFSKKNARICQKVANFFEKICLVTVCRILQNLAKFLTIFEQKVEIEELCKGMHCVDLGESCQTHIFLQNLAPIQPVYRRRRRERAL